MYIRRCSMSSISEESETGDDEHLDEEFIVCPDNNDIQNNHHHHNERKDPSIPNLSVNNCLGDLNAFKEVSFFFFLLSLTSIRSLSAG